MKDDSFDSNYIPEDYTIITKTSENIIEELGFDDNDEALLCESIIQNLEKNVSKVIRDNKTAQIPFIGCIRINPVKRQLRDSYNLLSLARKQMSKEEYKDYVRDYVNEIKEKQKNKDFVKLTFTKIRRNNKKKYDNLYKRLGRAYAEMYIYAIYLLKEVPYDAEWEEHYKSLKD